MNLIKRELKDNLKSISIWLLIILILLITIIIIHPLAIEKMSSLNEMLEQFPQDIIKALNLTNTSFEDILDYFFYEFQFILLSSCILGGILGANIIAKEETDNTIQFLFAKPISRTNILLAKIITTLIYLLLFNFILFSTTAITINLTSNQSINYLTLCNLFSNQLLLQITYASLGILIATLISKPKTSSSLIGGIIIVSFILGIISKIADKVASLSYLSFTTYLMNDNFIELRFMEVKYTIILFLVSTISFVTAIIKYRKKQFFII